MDDTEAHELTSAIERFIEAKVLHMRCQASCSPDFDEKRVLDVERKRLREVLERDH